MPKNYSSTGNSKRISLGSGTLRLKAWGGTTPSTSDDVGFSQGSQFTVNRTRTDVKQGVPRTLVVQYAIEEEATLQFTSLEWNAARAEDLLGAGTVAGSGSDQHFFFGGTMAYKELQAEYVHQMAAGGTVTLDVWRCQGTGELALNFTDEFHQFPYNLRALAQTTDWGGTSLGEDKTLFRIRIQLPA